MADSSQLVYVWALLVRMTWKTSRRETPDSPFIIEAGLYPGVAYYITLWYPRNRAQFRQALFFSAASIAGAFSGLLAYGIAVSARSSNLRLFICLTL